MKTFPFPVLAVAFMLAVHPAFGVPTLDSGPTATVVIERPENTGRLDLMPVTILVNSSEVNVVESGSKTTVSVPAGSFTLTVRSRNPDDATSTQTPIWASDNMPLTMGSGDSLRVVIRPGMNGNAYSGHWDMEKTAK